MSWDYVGEFLDNCFRVLVGFIHRSVLKEGLVEVLLVKVYLVLLCNTVLIAEDLQWTPKSTDFLPCL